MAGIIPLAGTPAWEEMARRQQLAVTANPGRNVDALRQQAAQSMGQYRQLEASGGPTYGIMSSYLQSPAALGGGLGGGGGAGGEFSMGSSSMQSGAGLLGEILGLIRGTGMKEQGAARWRLMEDYGDLRQQKMSDLARRGLFRAGVGEQELLREVDKPLSRGLSDLASNLADQNVDVSLRKAAILGDIEAQARKAMSERMAAGASIGSGAQTVNPSIGGGFGSGYTGGGGDGGGIFGASFVDARRARASGGQGGAETGFMPNVPYLGGAGGPGMSASQAWNKLATPGPTAVSRPTGPQGQTLIRSTSGAMGYRAPSGAFVYYNPATQQQQPKVSAASTGGGVSGSATLRFGR